MGKTLIIKGVQFTNSIPSKLYVYNHCYLGKTRSVTDYAKVRCFETPETEAQTSSLKITDQEFIDLWPTSYAEFISGNATKYSLHSSPSNNFLTLKITKTLFSDYTYFNFYKLKINGNPIISALFLDVNGHILKSIYEGNEFPGVNYLRLQKERIPEECETIYFIAYLYENRVNNPLQSNNPKPTLEEIKMHEPYLSL